MTDFSALIQQGAGNVWLFIPSAILLGVLHGLEPGHSKTMMAAFIVAVHGTVRQAVLLGLSATLSHTAVVWVVALSGLYFGAHWNSETSEPYFQLISAVLMIAVAVWMMTRTWRFTHPKFHLASHDHAHDHHHDHSHHHAHDHDHEHHHHAHHDHSHHEHQNHHSLLLQPANASDYQDPHELEHANDIRRRFANKHVTTPQIIIFGLTGGLIPCPAAITVLLLCLQLKKVTMGAALVLCFSIGLALTMVISGVLAALSVKHVSKHWSGFGDMAHYAPYFSGTIITVIGLYIGYHGALALLK